MKHRSSSFTFFASAALCAAEGIAVLAPPRPAAAQEAAPLTIVQPETNATEVPTNSGLVFHLQSPFFVDDSDPQLSGALLLRAPDGSVRNVRAELVRTAPSEVWLTVEPLALAQNTRYEVLSRLILDDTEGVSQLRLQDEYAPLAAFETGATADEQAPMFAVVSEPEAGSESCSYVVEVSGTDDETSDEALFFQTEEGSLGSPRRRVTLSGQVEPGESGPTVTRRIWARDAAGNLSEPQVFELDACVPFDISQLGCDTCVSDQGAGADPDSGCSIAAGTASSHESSLPWLGLLLLGSTLGIRRRERRTRR